MKAIILYEKDKEDIGDTLKNRAHFSGFQSISKNAELRVFKQWIICLKATLFP